MTTPDPQPSLFGAEPVAVTEAIRVVLMAAVAAGWLTLPSTVIDAIITITGAVLSVGMSIWARAHVTPVTPAPPAPPATEP